MPERLRIYIIGVGGQGTLTAARLLGEAALRRGLEAVVSEVHGMAQRGGIVETGVLLGGYKGPVIGRGEADLVLAFEPLEALRAVLALGKASKEGLVLTNTHPIRPITVSLKLGEYPDLERAFAEVERRVARLIKLEATALAKEAGSALALNMVMLGALAATELLPFPPIELEEGIKGFSPRWAEVNLRAFRLGLEAVAQALV
ncbi:MAG: indolepyruvate oxidoreductase subunit beta [Candidatus Bipolaricaulia bacterium]